MTQSEGVDIPALDLLLFLRPTESPIVFLQQLGRGLRTYKEKNDVRVLDFIGNFKKVDLIPFLLGNRLESKKDIVRKLQNGEGLPQDCQVDFEFQVIDLIESVINSRMKIQEKVDEWFSSCCEEISKYEVSLGLPTRLPTRIEFFKWLSDDQYQAFKKQKKFNPFKDYVRFILRYDKDNQSMMSEEILASNEYRFIQCIETTGMNQLYKIPVLASFVKSGSIVTEVTIDEIIDSFIEFYSNNRNRLDIVRRKTMGEPREFTRDMWRKIIMTNPVHFLSKTHSDLFELDGDLFRIKLAFDYVVGDEQKMEWFVGQVEDVLSFRRGEFLDQRLE